MSFNSPLKTFVNSNPDATEFHQTLLVSGLIKFGEDFKKVINFIKLIDILLKKGIYEIKTGFVKMFYLFYC